MSQINVKVQMPCLKWRFAVLIALASCIAGVKPVFAQSQSIERYAPPISRTDGGGVIRTKELSSGLSDEQRRRILAPQVRGIVIVDEVKRVRPNVGATDVVVEARPGSVPPEVIAAARKYVGTPLNFDALDALSHDMVVAYRDADRPVVNVVIPRQEVSGGVIQVLVVVGRLAQVKVEGVTSSDPQSILREIHLTPGEPIQESVLLEDLRYLNRNPLRRIDVLYEPGKAFGQTNVVLQVAEDKPWTVYGGAETKGGIGPLGEYRIFEGGLAYNTFGLGEVVGYQFTHTPDPRFLQAHVASLRLPLPERFELQVVGGYSTLNAPAQAGGFLNQTGQNTFVGTYLDHALPRFGIWAQDFRFGAEYKRTNNNLDVAGLSIVAANPEVYQGVLGYSGEMYTDLGKTRFETNLYGSPGGASADNTDAMFNVLRANAPAKYIYSRSSLNQRVDLPNDFRLLATVEGQYSNVNLLPTEAFLLGGLGSVRGLPYAIASADSGVTADLTLYSPTLGSVIGPSFLEQLRAYTFFDHGSGWVRNPLPLQAQYIGLTAAGLGLSYEAAKYVQLDAGYGWNITKTGISPQLYDQPGRFFGRLTVRY